MAAGVTDRVWEIEILRRSLTHRIARRVARIVQEEGPNVGRLGRPHLERRPGFQAAYIVLAKGACDQGSDRRRAHRRRHI